MDNKKKVSRARKFVAGLALVLAMSGLSGCGIKNNNDDKNLSIESEYNQEDEIIDDVVIPDDLSVDESLEDESLDNNEESDEKEQYNQEEIKENDEDTISQEESNDVSEEEAVVEISLPDIGEYQGYSIVEALVRAGYPADFNSRKILAESLGIENYRGTAEQNIQLLNLLRKYHESLTITPPVNNEETQIPSEDTSEVPSDESRDDNQGSTDDDSKEDDVHRHQYRLIESASTAINQENSGHIKINHYECSCGDYYVTTTFEKHKTNTKTVHENETADGYDLVVYEYCTECNYQKEVSRTYVSKQEECEHTYEDREVVTSISNTEHERKTYKECSKCHDIKDEITVQENHDIKIETVHENETDDGYDLVEYEYCTECDYRKEISRTHVSTQECEHANYREEVKIENETAEGHEEVTYQVCTECGHREEISRITVTHVYVQEADVTIENVNGCTYDEVYYETCTCGEHTYRREKAGTRVTKTEHNFIETSRTDAKPSEIEPGKHNIIVTYTCSVCGATKEETLTDSCTPGDTKCEKDPNDNKYYDNKYCTGCGGLVSHDAHTNHKSGDWIERENGTGAYKLCGDCGERVEDHAHNYGDSGDVCITCGHKKEEQHTCSPVEERKPNSEDDNNCYVVIKKCSCGKTEEIPKPHDMNWDEPYEMFGYYFRHGVCKDCNHEVDQQLTPDEYKALGGVVSTDSVSVLSSEDDSLLIEAEATEVTEEGIIVTEGGEELKESQGDTVIVAEGDATEEDAIIVIEGENEESEDIVVIVAEDIKKEDTIPEDIKEEQFGGNPEPEDTDEEERKIEITEEPAKILSLTS